MPVEPPAVDPCPIDHLGPALTALDIRTSPPGGPANELELAERQLDAVARFHRARRIAELATSSLTGSREQRMDAARRLEVLRRQHTALTSWTERQLKSTGERSVLAPPALRAVLGHRNAWFGDKVTAALADHEVEVLARVPNGADLVGISVAEQPDVVLIGDGLEMMPTTQVVASLQDLCPHTTITAQVDYADRVPALVSAGVGTVFVRQTPPVDVAATLAELLA